MKPKVKKILSISAGFVILIIAAIGFGAYWVLYYPNFKPDKTKYIYIYENDKDFGRFCHELKDSVQCVDINTFRMLADFREYPHNMKSGRYSVENGMSNMELLNKLRRSQQTPIRLTFNNIRLITDLTERLSEQLMLNEDELLSLIIDEDYCASLGFNITTISAMFIPNTYEVYWNITAEKLMERMKREYDAFWTKDRLKKAENIRLTPIEVSILASVVEEETAAADEYPVVAGLYINRLYKGMPLQADPTVKFAVGDFTLQRVLNKHLEINSPYNTYIYSGLPPGPIRIPSPRSIDAVLNYTKHNYMYMCAKEDFSGRHSFAVTLSEHNRNANLYRAELNRRGIR
ncbi:MAG: endolytic transglycosylase MltG [Bacteroidales bacterium]|jgi:UPF0755 protein|nr:endolytic transglycosylase MltG [Bacteroidales bacterium]